jgi:hypothetical protein
MGAPSLNEVPGSQISLVITGRARFGQTVSLGTYVVSPIQAGRAAYLILIPYANVSGAPFPKTLYVAEDLKYYRAQATAEDLILEVVVTGLSSGAKVQVTVPSPAHALFFSIYNILLGEAGRK